MRFLRSLLYSRAEGEGRLVRSLSFFALFLSHVLRVRTADPLWGADVSFASQLSYLGLCPWSVSLCLKIADSTNTGLESVKNVERGHLPRCQVLSTVFSLSTLGID